MISVLFLNACMASDASIQPLTKQLIASGVQLDSNVKGLSGFDVYAMSPKFKAFAASIGKAGYLHAWAKA
jgi:hypothetical protein